MTLILNVWRHHSMKLLFDSPSIMIVRCCCLRCSAFMFQATHVRGRHVRRKAIIRQRSMDLSAATHTLTYCQGTDGKAVCGADAVSLFQFPSAAQHYSPRMQEPQGARALRPQTSATAPESDNRPKTSSAKPSMYLVVKLLCRLLKTTSWKGSVLSAKHHHLRTLQANVKG
jgi:hypothetical protein